jgi:hypothetical protein
VRDGQVRRIGTPEECIAAYLEDIPAAGHDVPMRVAAITTVNGDQVRSGERLALRVTGMVDDVPGARRASVGLRIRALPSDEPVFGTDSVACGIHLAPGAFDLAVDLQMNVGAGLYRAQAFVYRPDDEREWAAGPSALIRVERSPVSFGRVNLLPSMRLLSS